MWELPSIIGALIAALYGAVVGSFLNVCIYRLPRGESLVAPPSHCPSCNTRLKPRDLVPIFSFLLLRGKCRYCHTKITWRYAIIEAITAVLFAAVWLSLYARVPFPMWSGSGFALMVAASVFVSAMLVTFMIDLETTYVIEPVTWLAMAAGLVFEVVLRYQDTSQWLGSLPIYFQLGGLTIPWLPAAIPGMLIGFAVFVAMDLFGRLIFRKPGMGLGDAYIGAAIGAMLGPAAALLSFGMAIVLGALVGIVLMIAGAIARTPAPGASEARATRKEAAAAPFNDVEDEEELPEGRYMPFGPFLTGAATLVALAPDWFLTSAHRLLDWWLNSNPFLS